MLSSDETAAGHPAVPEQRQSPARWYAVVGLTFGLVFLVVTPPFQAPDEVLHFWRAFQLSEGVLVGGGVAAEIPWSFYDLNAQLYQARQDGRRTIRTILSEFKRPLRQPDRRVKAEFRAVTLYPPVPYLPQAAGIAVGRLFHPSPILLLYLGRFANLAAGLALVWLAIRIVPVGKWVWFVLALSPMSVGLLASQSPDVLTNGLAFLITATCLRFAASRGRARRWDLTLLFIEAMALALTKPTYVSLVALCFLIPPSWFGSRTRYWVTTLTMFGLSIAVASLWMWLVIGLFVPNEPMTSPANQLRHVWNNPFAFVLLLASAVPAHILSWSRSYVGVLGNLDVVLPWYVYLSFPAVAVCAMLASDPAGLRLRGQSRAILAASALSSVVLVLTAAYLAWVRVGAGSIAGIQGRYFIPIAPALLLVLQPTSRILRLPDRFVGLFVLYSSLVLLTTSCVLLKVHFLR